MVLLPTLNSFLSPPFYLIILCDEGKFYSKYENCEGMNTLSKEK